ncbi:MAG: apolipoprotein N-acyltransferase [Myxococcota bacterium]
MIGMRWAVLLALGAGFLHAASMPGLGLWPLAFVSLTPLVIATRGRGALGGFALAWLAGTLAAGISVVPWIAAAAENYFEQTRFTALLFALLVSQLFGALWIGLFGVLLSRLSRLASVPGRVLAIAAGWATLEFIRAHVFTGAPWGLLAHALYGQPLLIQSADLGGAYLISFMLAASGAALGEIGVAPGRRALGALALAAGLIFLNAGYGAMRLAREDPPGAGVRVALVQGNVPNAWRSDPARFDDAFGAFAGPTRRVLAARPDLVVWPENAVSFLLEPNPRFLRDVADLLGPGGPPLLLGGPRYESSGGRAQFYNSAYLLSRAGEVLLTYDKRHLAPFAEYAPVAELPWLGWRFDAPGDYTEGRDATLFTRPDRYGVLICFEIIYPDLARDLVRGGARFLLNLSNDAWFGTSAGLEQHFAASVFRAVETRRAIARATNTGITGLVSPRGEVTARFPAHARDAWVVDVPLRETLSFYTRRGDLFAALAALGMAFSLLQAGPRR